MRFCLAILFALMFSAAAHAGEKPLPRVLVALFDSREESSPRTSQIHRFLEMPANHLGYDIHYSDVTEPLPALGDDTAGVILWFDIGVEVPDSKLFLDWLGNAVAHGKKLIIIENGGIGDSLRKDPNVIKRWNDVLSHIGVQDDNSWNEITYHAHIAKMDKGMVGFERAISQPLPPVPGMHVISGVATGYLQVQFDSTAGDNPNFDMVTTSPQGGYIAQGYALFHVEKKEGDGADIDQWFVNPFLFLQKSLDMALAPIPDATTLDGRRIFYSHIDGDGWNNISEIPEYQKNNTIAAEVIYDEILKPYSQFAFNVAPIGADLDPDCYGVRDSARVAREIFALPNVEPSSHTYSHPLFWQFFAHYSIEEEKALLSHYPARPKQKFSLWETLKEKMMGANADWPVPANPLPEKPSQPNRDAPIKRGRNEESIQEILKKYFDIPRSYACAPFDLDKEITGAVKQISALVPEGKKIELLQWSGDTSPFEEAIAKTRQAGLLNINGGDSRFDAEFPSYASVAPIGLQVGKERQIYSSNSNEDTYTNLWTGRFFGFRYLQLTVENTESPRRVRPFNIYFHIFSGQKLASLNAVKDNLEFARTQDIIPITASHYAAIADGFYTTNIIPLGNNSWRVINRGALQTVRFIDTEKLSADFDASQGVIGQRYFQHNLYIALDPAVESPIITLKNNDNIGVLPAERNAYLIESNFGIKSLLFIKNRLTFQAQGYGNGSMLWKVSKAGEYVVTIEKKQGVQPVPNEMHVTVGNDGILPVSIGDTDVRQGITVSINAL